MYVLDNFSLLCKGVHRMTSLIFVLLTNIKTPVCTDDYSWYLKPPLPIVK